MSPGHGCYAVAGPGVASRETGRGSVPCAEHRRSVLPNDLRVCLLQEDAAIGSAVAGRETRPDGPCLRCPSPGSHRPALWPFSYQRSLLGRRGQSRVSSPGPTRHSEPTHPMAPSRPCGRCHEEPCEERRAAGIACRQRLGSPAVPFPVQRRGGPLFDGQATLASFLSGFAPSSAVASVRSSRQPSGSRGVPSLARNGPAAQRSTIPPPCHFAIRRVRSRTSECGLSTRLVVARHRRSSGDIPRRLTDRLHLAFERFGQAALQVVDLGVGDRTSRRMSLLPTLARRTLAQEVRQERQGAAANLSQV